MDHVYSPDMTVIIESFENAIRLGHTLLSLLWSYYKHRGFADVDLLYRRLCSILELCIIVGAAICNREDLLRKHWEDYLSDMMNWMCENLLASSIEKVQQRSLPTGTDARSSVRPAPSTAQWEVVEKLARKINQDQDLNLNKAISNLTHLNFLIQLERFED